MALTSPIVNFSDNLGLLRVPLLAHQELAIERYMLLNSIYDNLCVDALEDADENHFVNRAWSSGSSYYLLFENSHCNVFRFDSQKVERYPSEVVVNNAEKFLNYLSRNKRNEENMVVPFALRLYRKLRSEMPNGEGDSSLSAFLYLLAASAEDNVNVDQWGLSDVDREHALSVGDAKWEMLLSELKEGINLNGRRLKPDVELILRHTAGRLFEEANYYAYLPIQLSIFPEARVKYQYNRLTQDGAYFTPSYVARSIVEETLRKVDYQNKQHITIFDPACGAGGFLVEALRQLKMNGYNQRVTVIGWDIANTAVLLSKFALSFEKKEWGDDLIIDVQPVDSTLRDWPQSVDVLLMNPPFISWDMLSQEQRERVVAIMGEKGKINLAAAFLQKALSSVGADGALGAVLPSAILSDKTYSGVRQRLQDNYSVNVVGNLGSFVFESVLAYTSMLVASRQPQENTVVMWTGNMPGAAERGIRALRRTHNSRAIENGEDYSVYSYNLTERAGDNNSWKPVSYANLVKINNLNALVESKTLRRIKDLFNVYLGSRTGSNSIFVIDGHYYDSLPENERPYFLPSVDNLAIDAGKLSIVNYLFFPDNTALPTIIDEADLSEKLPTYYNQVLLPNKSKLRSRRVLPHPDRWWELASSRNWQKERKPKMVSTEFGRSGSFAIDYDGQFVVERGCMWELKDSKWQSALPFYKAYLAIFNSPVMDELLQAYSIQLAGGRFYKLGNSSVENIPMVDLRKVADKRTVKELASYADKMKAGEFWDEEELEQLVRKVMLI